MPSLRWTLKQKNVTLLDEQRIHLKCDKCGAVWSPNLLERGRLPKRYWKCPNSCNTEPETFKHPPEVREYFKEKTRKYRQARK